VARAAATSYFIAIAAGKRKPSSEVPNRYSSRPPFFLTVRNADAVTFHRTVRSSVAE